MNIFDYHLPKEKIAQKPLQKRDESKLLLCKSTGRMGAFTEPFDFQTAQFSSIQNLLTSNDVLVLNNSKVLPVRLNGNRLNPDGSKGGEVEALLLERDKNDTSTWSVLLHLSAKVRPGLQFLFEPGLVAECLSTVEERKNNTGVVRIRFSGLVYEKQGLEPWLLKHGHVPLPPYIDRGDSVQDRQTYQTVYAQTAGSAAAPTAGFHFTDELLKNLEHKGVTVLKVTLHVGLGTFKPIETEKLEDHPMHEESYEISKDLSQGITTAKKLNKRIVAVGTTVVRALESWAAVDPNLTETGIFRTSIFIRPGYQFKIIDDLVTNFHMPRTTLLALVAAGMGYENMMTAYNKALQEDYRFLSYGDAQFIRGK